MRAFLSRLGAHAHSRVVKTSFALLFLLLVASVSIDAARMSGIVDVAVPQLLPGKHKMATVTYGITLENGTVLTLTVVQNEGETADEFAARAARMWAAFLAAHGL